jgi:lincosamide nucleotidyltransferase A/C/D/E
MNRDDVLDVLGRLDAAHIESWVDGGWGVDALLGEETRTPDDLDLAIRREAGRRPRLVPSLSFPITR